MINPRKYSDQPAATQAPHAGRRDLRVDFFRGLALLFIFIDHVPNNTWANYTLRNFGFCDASEAFVFLSGYAAMLAYGRATLSFDEMARRAYRRALTVYVWHLGVFAVSAALLFAAAAGFSDPGYVGNVALQRLGENTAESIANAVLLTYQPNQLNILPLYVVLLLWFPLIAALLRRNVLAALALSACIWAIANIWSVNLTANQPGEGWYFNPLAWQLLFTTGAAAAIVNRPVDVWARGMAIGAAGTFVVFSFIYAAPWTLYSWAPDGRLLPTGAVGDISKTYLSIWRYLNILALAYFLAEVVPVSAAFLRQKWSRVFVACGQKSLQVFALGTVLSFVAWIASSQLATSAAIETIINLSGLALLSGTAVYLASLSRGRSEKSESSARLFRA